VRVRSRNRASFMHSVFQRLVLRIRLFICLGLGTFAFFVAVVDVVVVVVARRVVLFSHGAHVC